MNPEKAIEILKNLSCRSSNQGFIHEVNALELGIEALTFIHLSRHTTPGTVPTLLHGETNE